jgi:hypothetical protein
MDSNEVLCLKKRKKIREEARIFINVVFSVKMKELLLEEHMECSCQGTERNKNS